MSVLYNRKVLERLPKLCFMSSGRRMLGTPELKGSRSSGAYNKKMILIILIMQNQEERVKNNALFVYYVSKGTSSNLRQYTCRLRAIIRNHYSRNLKT
jgi:hypothetical protein